MTKFIQVVLEKLGEYGIEVYDQDVIDEKTYVLMTTAYTLFLNAKEKSLAVSFHAATKPEYVANHTIILKEIDEIKRFDIMESFAYNSDREIISGDEAFQAVEEQVMNNIKQQQNFMNILMKEECFSC